MFRKLAVTAVFLTLASPRVMALGLGEIDMHSALNQPLDAVIELTSSTGLDPAELKISIASAEAFARAGLNRSAILGTFRFTVEQGKGSGAVVRITSADPVREPYLEFLLELDWPKGKLLRQYTVLVDPPVTMAAARPVTTPASVRAAAPRAATLPAKTPVASPLSAPVVQPASVAASEYGPIQRSDTLWSIAERIRPDAGVTTHQVMQALLRTNPDAFIGNNINRMKAGYTLHVPSLDEMRSQSASAAVAESRRQYQEWLVESNKAAAPETSTAAAATGTEETAPADRAATGATPQQAEDTHLSLVAPENDSVNSAAQPGDQTAGNETSDAASSAGASVNQQLALATEEAAASKAQSVELQSRVTELEQQVDTMKRLLELKDSALANLQNRSAQPDSAVTVAGPAAESEPAAAPEVTPAPVSAGQTESWVDRLMQNPLLVGAFALVVAILAVFMWLANRRNDDDSFDEEMTLARHIARQGEQPNKVPPQIDIREPERQDDTVHPAAEDADTLTEVDVYLAYGRVKQAEELLQAALREHPNNDALLQKLLEVYHASGNVAAFDQAASDYRDGVDEGDERWHQVAAMGYSLSPQNELYRVAATTEATAAVEPAQAQQTPPEPLPDVLEFNLDDYAEHIEDEQEGVLAAEDEIATKLDLARAYIDMDDRESARSILDEVMEEGNTDQRQEAERIIARLA